MDNRLQIRVNKELLDHYKGKPDLITEALTMYKRAQENFLKEYNKTIDRVVQL